MGVGRGSDFILRCSSWRWNSGCQAWRLVPFTCRAILPTLRALFEYDRGMEIGFVNVGKHRTVTVLCFWIGSLLASLVLCFFFFCGTGRFLIHSCFLAGSTGHHLLGEIYWLHHSVFCKQNRTSWFGQKRRLYWAALGNPVLRTGHHWSCAYMFIPNISYNTLYYVKL